MERDEPFEVVPRWRGVTQATCRAELLATPGAPVGVNSAHEYVLSCENQAVPVSSLDLESLLEVQEGDV